MRVSERGSVRACVRVSVGAGTCEDGGEGEGEGVCE